MSKNCLDLLEIIKQQQEMIEKQNNVIIDLTNQNAEQENMINVLLSESCAQA